MSRLRRLVAAYLFFYKDNAPMVLLYVQFLNGNIHFFGAKLIGCLAKSTVLSINCWL